MTTGYLDQPPADWFPIAVMRTKARSRDWVALVVDVSPDELETRSWDNPVWLYVHPAKYRPEAPRGRHAYVRIGKHRNQDAAWAALEEIMATRH